MPPANLFDDPLDRLLAEIALRIQLPPSKHRLACERYEAVAAYAERDSSPLKGLIARFYPQGSMAIGATIAARGRDEEYDIDIVAELLLAVGSDPRQVLDCLFAAIRGEKGSRYHDMVKRRTRCVTVYYEDGMHLDITPTILRPERPERSSDLFHDDPDEPAESAETLLMNAWGFTQYFKASTADTTGFAEAYAKRAYAAEIRAGAETEPVDPQDDPARKSSDVVALQLIKRQRNSLYGNRDERMPPSVLLSKYVADRAQPGESLTDALLMHAEYIRDQLKRAEARGGLVHAVNPTCEEDCFTDRWPLTRADQRLYMADLEDLVDAIRHMRYGDVSIRDMQERLVPLFGKSPVNASVRAVQEHVGRATQAARTGHKIGGGIIIGGSENGRMARTNTNMGGRSLD